MWGKSVWRFWRWKPCFDLRVVKPFLYMCGGVWVIVKLSKWYFLFRHTPPVVPSTRWISHPQWPCRWRLVPARASPKRRECSQSEPSHPQYTACSVNKLQWIHSRQTSDEILLLVDCTEFSLGAEFLHNLVGVQITEACSKSAYLQYIIHKLITTAIDKHYPYVGISKNM